MGWGCSSIGRALDWHATDAGFIPRCSKRFFSQSQLSVRTYSKHPLAQSHAFTSVPRLKIPVVHVRVHLIMETLRHPACIRGWVAQLCCSWLSLGKATQIFYGRNPILQYSWEKKSCLVHDPCTVSSVQ